MAEQKKYALVTFLFDGYDLLREPLVVDDKFDYYCLTDDKDLKSDTFKCIYIEEFDTDKLSGVQKTYMAKYSFYKYLPSGYEYYFTIDASIEVAYKLYPIVQFMESGKYEVGLSMHPERGSWRDEYMFWTLARGVDKKYVKTFNEYAESLGLDPSKNNGLIECTVKLYKNTDSVISFIDDVYKTLGETNNFEDKNDQCYFTCVYYKHKEELKTFFFTRQLYSNSRYFNSYHHKTSIRWHNTVSLSQNTNELFGKKVELVKFDESADGGLDLFIGTYKTFEPKVHDKSYKIIVGNHEIENRSDLKLIKCGNPADKLDDRFYSEFYMLRWIAQNVELGKYVGYCHYRKYFGFMDDVPDMEAMFSEYDALACRPLMFNTSVRQQYATFHNAVDFDVLSGVIAVKYPNLFSGWNTYIGKNVMIPYDMFVMRADMFKEYVSFVSNVMDGLTDAIGCDIEKRILDNKDKYLKPFPPNNTVDYQYRFGGYLIERLTSFFIILMCKRIKFYDTVLTENKYGNEKVTKLP